MKTHDAGDGTGHLDGTTALRRAETGHFQKKLSSGKDDIGELSVDPSATFGPVVGAHEDFARLVQDVLAPVFLAVHVHQIVATERIEQDVDVILAAEFLDARARTQRRRFDGAAPQTDQSRRWDVDLTQSHIQVKHNC